MEVRSFSKRIELTSVLLQVEHLQKKPDALERTTLRFSFTDTQVQWNDSLQVSQVSLRDALLGAVQAVAENGAIDMLC